jgi:hypothetical protein
MEKGEEGVEREVVGKRNLPPQGGGVPFLPLPHLGQVLTQPASPLGCQPAPVVTGPAPPQPSLTEAPAWHLPLLLLWVPHNLRCG